MRKGFINILGLLVVGGFVAVSALFSAKIYQLEKQIQSIQKPMKFGTITGSGSFPTSTLNNFQDGDTINAGDWNALERKIGIDHSTDTTSLDYLLRSPTSTNPGHIHTTSSITGVWGVSQGGTGNTSATANNLLVGNGTSSFTSVAPGSTNNVLASVGGVWTSVSAGSVLSGSNILDASSTNISIYSTTATTTMMSITVNSSTIQNPITTKIQGIHIVDYFDKINMAGNNFISFYAFVNGTSSANSLGSSTIENFGGGNLADWGKIDLNFLNTNVVNQYQYTFEIFYNPRSSSNNNSSTLSTGLISITPTSTITLYLQITNDTNNPANGVRQRWYKAEFLTQ